MKSYELKPTEENIYKTIDEDIFNRNDVLRNFYDILVSQEDSEMIALDGKWGSGKTFFIKQEIILLKAMNPYIKEDRDKLNIVKSKIMRERNLDPVKANMLPVYYDAWQNDNDIDPIVSLCCEIADQIGKQFSPSAEFDKKKALVAIADHFLNTNIGEICDSVKVNEYVEHLLNRRRLEDDVRDFFNGLCDEKANRIIIFIDELDRCKPSYAVRLLEQIKHYMCDERITFILAVNTAQLQHTIRHFYGSEFDACRYLDRFFDLRTSLPAVNMNRFYESIGVYDSEMIDIVGKALINEYRLDLREITRFMGAINQIKETVITRVGLGSYDEVEGRKLINYMIIPVVIVLHMTDINAYNRFIDGEDASPLIRMYNAEPYNFIWFISHMLNRDESLEKDEGKKLVTPEDVLKKVYNAVFGKHAYSDKDVIVLGSCRFRRSSREYAMTVAGMLFDRKTVMRDTM